MQKLIVPSLTGHMVGETVQKGHPVFEKRLSSALAMALNVGQ